MFTKVPRADFLIIVAVTVITVFTDLAVAVISGVILSALVFAWEHAKHIRADVSETEQGEKVYEIDGPLFFASASNFQEIFTPEEDTDEVIVDFKRSRVADHSALDAIDRLAERYKKEGKTLHLRHLSPECRKLLTKAHDFVEVDELEDPTYRLAMSSSDVEEYKATH